MTKEARKWAFKESIACGIPTIFLTAIIMYFTMRKEFAAAPLSLAELGVKLGGTVTVTALICCVLQYLIVGKAFKAQFAEGAEKLPAMGARSEQVLFPLWVPSKWWVYVIFVALFAGALFGTGIPCFLVSGVAALDNIQIGRLGHAILAGIINGVGTWWAVYAAHIYLVQFFNEKAAAAARERPVPYAADAARGRGAARALCVAALR